MGRLDRCIFASIQVGEGHPKAATALPRKMGAPGPATIRTLGAIQGVVELATILQDSKEADRGDTVVKIKVGQNGKTR